METLYPIWLYSDIVSYVQTCFVVSLHWCLSWVLKRKTRVKFWLI